MNKELKNKGESLPLATKQSFSATPSSGDTPQRPVKTDCHSELQNCHSELVSESHFELQNCHSELVSESHFPNIRFSGFSDSWQEKKLGDVAEIGDGLHGTPEYDDTGDIYFINGNNLVDGEICITPETKTVNSSQQSNNDKNLNENTVLMSINGTIGNLAFYKGEKLMLGKSAAFIKILNQDKFFVFSVLQTNKMKDNFFNNLTGTTIKNLGLGTIRNTNISFPALTEQQKIGSYFATLDKKITAQKAKVEQLKTLKKYMLQNMFPQTIKNAEQQNCHSALENCDSELQNCHSELVSESHFELQNCHSELVSESHSEQQNCHSELVSESHFEQQNCHSELVSESHSELQNCHSELVSESHFPKIRFAGFSDPWEEKKLGDVAEYKKGNGYSKKDLKSSGSPIILYGRLYTNYETIINDIDTFVDEQKNSVKSIGGDVIIPASGETAEDIARASVVSEKDIILGGDLNILNLKESYNSEFTALLISNGKVQKELSKKAQGKSVVHIHNYDIQSLNASFPSLPEQQKIGSYFATLDKNIANQNAKLLQLQTLKKYMLQNMFC